MERSVYLAGPITGRSWGGATEWREVARDRLRPHGIVGVSPLRAKDYLLAETSLGDQYDEFVLSTQKAIVTRDRWDCQRCDVVLLNLTGAERVSIGTMMEAGWADAARRPIILAMDEGNVHDHAMLREVAGFVVPTLGDALDVAVALLAGT